MKDPSLEVPQVVNVQTDHGTFPVSLSEDGNLVEMAWINQHLGILNEDLNLNPPAENADSLEELETVTVQKVKGKKGGAGHVRKVDRDKSLNLDLQSNHRAWTRGEVREERGGSQNFSDVRKEKNLKEAYSLKTPEKGKGSWVRKSKVKSLGFCVNNAKLVIGKSRSDLGRGVTDEDNSWTSSEAESGEVRKGCDIQWKGECSKNVGLNQEAHEVSKEGQTSEFLHDNLCLEDPEAQPQIMESPSEGGTSGLAVNNLEGQMVIYVKETQLHSSMSSEDDSTQMEDRISPISGDVLAACGEVSKVVNRPGKKNQVMIMRERNPVKIHNMQTRSAKKGSSSKKAVDGEWIATKVSWNLDNEMARIVEESVARVVHSPDLPPYIDSSSSLQAAAHQVPSSAVTVTSKSPIVIVATPENSAPVLTDTSSAAITHPTPKSDLPLLPALSQQIPHTISTPISSNKHHMVTRAKNNIHKPVQKLNLHTQIQHSTGFEPTT
ncbi:hypothetical protein LWI29_006612 [Acer saccharum]|uniref:Uncharacterized protein n=1 Tax=Acer saccharum TaxID=4024 RepID=A0AA39VSM1_ACESA|nr:hypothetical protein LWI29_006612 [Acer saccharum]